jgi:hypothetical protein
MIIVGYTDEKDVLQVEVSIAQIVASGIDPFRLDLMDPDPATIETERGKLNFCRLRDVVFAYQHNRDHDIVVCVHDGDDAHCFFGKRRGLRDESEKRIVITDITQSEKSFSEHLHEYLSALVGTALGADGANWAPAIARAMGATGNIYCTINPRRSQALTMTGSQFVFALQERSIRTEWLGYSGTMFEEMTLRVKLDKRINWVFQNFAQWQPLVFGDSLRLSLVDEQSEEIMLRLDEGCFPALKEKFGGKQYIDEFHLVIDDCKYRILRKTGGSLRDNCLRLPGEYSCDFLQSSGPDEVCGYRIALFDVVRHQFRPLSLSTSMHLSDSISRSKQLKKQGFSLKLES